MTNFNIDLTVTNTETKGEIKFNDTLNVSTAGNTLPVYLTGDNAGDVCKEALTDSSLIDGEKVGVKSFSSGKMLKLSNNGTCGNKDAYTIVQELDNGQTAFLLVELKICDKAEFNFKSPTATKSAPKTKAIDVGF